VTQWQRLSKYSKMNNADGSLRLAISSSGCSKRVYAYSFSSGALRVCLTPGRDKLVTLPTRVALPRDIQLQLSQWGYWSPPIHNMGPCGRPREDPNVWKQLRPKLKLVSDHRGSSFRRQAPGIGPRAPEIVCRNAPPAPSAAAPSSAIAQVIYIGRSRFTV
jgi:hypothetical protein